MTHQTAPADLILEATATLRRQLLDHSVYRMVDSVDALRVFMRDHSFAVLDFMWLLKRLQTEFAGTSHPWTPPLEPELARFVNEIVLGEESDEDGQGGHCSHFELYLRSMTECGADTIPIQTMLHALRQNEAVPEALAAAGAPPYVTQFVTSNAELSQHGSLTQVVAGFCFGREDIIPDMFQLLLDELENHGLHAPAMQFYIRRHIELDEEYHGPLTRRMINTVCNSPQRIAEAIAAAEAAISHRIRLWDGVVHQLQQTSVGC
ncbi:MAG: DUF3050 domain-containing protein [Planctomycetaceae bacterium]